MMKLIWHALCTFGNFMIDAHRVPYNSHYPGVGWVFVYPFGVFIIPYGDENKNDDEKDEDDDDDGGGGGGGGGGPDPEPDPGPPPAGGAAITDAALRNLIDRERAGV